MGDNQKAAATSRQATKRDRGKVPGSGGKRRAPHEMEAIQKRVEMLMLLGSSRQEIAGALKLSVATVDDYIARQRDLWKENPLPGRDEAREQAVRRYMKELRTVIANNGSTRDRAVWEDFLIRVQGTEAPRQLIASTPPGRPIEVQLRDPREMTTGERRRRIAELEAEEAAAGQAMVAVTAAVAAPAAEPGSDAT